MTAKGMQIAVHVNGEPGGFAREWIARLLEIGARVKSVDCHADDIMRQLEDCDGLMWHWSHSDPAAILVARQIVASVEASGRPVFPDSRTCWHFDDKVGQKYLLEGIEAPLVPSHVFLEKDAALAWLETARVPLVFKLRGGAAAQNVRLVPTRSEARRLVRRMFGRGLPPLDQRNLVKDRYRRLKASRNPGALWGLARGVARWMIPSRVERVKGRESGYCYFQEFMAGNDGDTRVIVIGSRAFAIQRFNREHDFRASGSGRIGYDHTAIDLRCVRIAYDVASRLGAQCLAFDFVRDAAGAPRIVEISYAFSAPAYDASEGYWDRDMRWHDGCIHPLTWMVDDFVASIPTATSAATLELLECAAVGP
jgi:glutathione synthase/RimK-type ligase-like ATP-grasp enzyme